MRGTGSTSGKPKAPQFTSNKLLRVIPFTTNSKLAEEAKNRGFTDTTRVQETSDRRYEVVNMKKMR